MRRRTLQLAPLVSLLLVSACSAFDTDEWGERREANERARARWEALGATSYSFLYRESCFCATAAYTPVAITVRNGAIESVEMVGRDGEIDPTALSLFPTIDQLFERVDAGIDERADRFDVDYHPRDGYPVKIVLDFRFNTADDESTASVTELELIEASL